MLKNIRLYSLHELNIVVGELEWSFLEIHVSGWAGYHEAKIYMDDMSLDIYEDIVVVSVFDVK